MSPQLERSSCFVSCFETGSHYVAQADLELTAVLQMLHHTQLSLMYARENHNVSGRDGERALPCG